MSKPNEGFDLDNYDFTEYASVLDGENLSSTDCDMEPESIWTPARRHKKRKASASPLNQVSYSEVVQSTIKKVPQIPKQRNVNSTKVFKYICIISCNSEKLGQQNQIKVQKLMSNLIGTVKSINSTKAGNLIVECIHCRQIAPVGNALSSSGTSQLGMFDIPETTKSKYYDHIVLLYLESRRCRYRSIIFACFYLYITVVIFIDYSDIDKMMDINNEKC